MRLKFKLKSHKTEFITPDYYYPLSAAIYKKLNFGSAEFSKFLHEEGYKLNGKRYKLFTFSLQFEKFKFLNGSIKLLSPDAYLYISSPLINDFIRNIILGSFINQKIEIHGGGTTSAFYIEQAEEISEPEFSGRENFIMMSPLALSTKRSEKDRTRIHYFRYNDDLREINRVFNKNLTNKYFLLKNEEYSGPGINLTWDEDYINRILRRNKFPSKKIAVKKAGIPPVEIKAIQTPFTLEGDPELMKIGYQTGFGEKNSMGFGMAEKV